MTLFFLPPSILLGGYFLLFLSFPSSIFLYMYLYSPPSSAAQIFVVVGDICTGWSSVFSVFWGQGHPEGLEDLYIL